MYKKVASNVLTVGQLKNALSNFNNEDAITLIGINGFSVAYNKENGLVLLDEASCIDDIIEQLNVPLEEEPHLDMSEQPYSVYEEAKEYLESWDCPVTRDNIIKCVTEWRDNLRSQIGEEAHKRSLALGIVDDTGMSWEEQDRYAIRQAARYEAYLKKISNSATPLNVMP